MIELTKINRAEAFRYMGLRGEPPENISVLADECESRLLSAANPKFHWIYADIADISEETVTLAGTALTSFSERYRRRTWQRLSLPTLWLPRLWSRSATLPKRR